MCLTSFSMASMKNLQTISVVVAHSFRSVTFEEKESAHSLQHFQGEAEAEEAFAVLL